MQDLHSGTITRAYCRAIYEESVSRCFILPPEQGWQGNTSHTSEHILHYANWICKGASATRKSSESVTAEDEGALATRKM